MVRIIEHAYGELRDEKTWRPVIGHMFLVDYSDYAAAAARIAALEAQLAEANKALDRIAAGNHGDRSSVAAHYEEIARRVREGGRVDD